MATICAQKTQKPQPDGGAFFVPQKDFTDFKADFADWSVNLRNLLFGIGEII